MNKNFANFFALTTFISVTAFYTENPTFANSLQDCVRTWQIEFPGISTDRALSECQSNGFPSQLNFEETKTQCIEVATQLLTRAYSNNSFRAASEGKEFCNNGGNSSCLNQSVNTLTRAYSNNSFRAASEGKEFCNNGGDSSCLVQSIDALTRAYSNNSFRAASEAITECQGVSSF